MKRYNREFLVMYLQNLCALHYAKRKLEIEINRVNKNISSKSDIPLLDLPVHEPVWGEDANLGCGFWSGFVLCLVLTVMLLFGNPYVRWLIIFPGGALCMFAIGIIIVHFEYLSNCKSHREYLDKIRKDNAERTRDNELRKKMRAPLYSRRQALEQEVDKINDLIYRAYSANIIPGPDDRYRTMYCAVHLYEYFSKGNFDDLESALNIYVLEQIKDRLDTIIRQNSDILLNQELTLANQMRSMEDQRNYRNNMLRKIDRMNCSIEESNQYRRAIDSHLETLEFFARDNYIRRICS